MEHAFILAVCLALLWSADANVEEEIRILNPNFNNGMSTRELEILINQANLPSFGYRKIVETKMGTDFKTGLAEKHETVKFLKEMPCNEVTKSEEILDKLLPGVFGKDVGEETKSEIQNRNIENLMCVSGIEFDRKTSELDLRRKRRGQDCGCTVRIVIIIVKKDQEKGSQ